MSRQTNILGYCVRADIAKTRVARSDADLKCEAERLANEIRRHCDRWDVVNVVEETEAVCEYCGAKWTEESALYNGCCSADCEAEGARKVEQERAIQDAMAKVDEAVAARAGKEGQ